jgi:hypothetical protein
LYQELLSDTSFFELLGRIDREQAEEVRQAGCPCGGVLHSARYRRKPRGGPAGLPEACCWRESFCCAQDGCRRRSTPPSVRFLGRKVFFGVVVLLVPILREGLTPRRFARLQEQLGVSRWTVLRWQRWWRELFAASRPWQRALAHLLPVDAGRLPGSLLAAFTEAAAGWERALAALRWLVDRGSGEARSTRAAGRPQTMRLGSRGRCP